MSTTEADAESNACCTQMQATVNTIGRILRRLFDCGNRSQIPSHRLRTLQPPEENAAEFIREQKCVYCGRTFRMNAKILMRPLSKEEAQQVTEICPCFINQFTKKVCHKHPQNPSEICTTCTIQFRMILLLGAAPLE